MDHFIQVFKQHKTNNLRNRVKTLAWRLERLKKLRDLITEARSPLAEALQKDLKKHPTETELSEILSTIMELDHTVANLKNWMQPISVSTPARLMGTHSYVRLEPKGVVLILAPWNYPFHLIMTPLIAALAAGNTAILKPSELTPNVSSLVADLVAKYFSPDEVFVVQGDSKVAADLCELPFDHIFFTGSTAIGKKVMAAAATNLTPVTLELGGKSPAILDETYSIPNAAQKLMWAKFLNAGQTCVAPDFVCVPKSLTESFLGSCVKTLDSMFPAKNTASESDMCRVVSESHFKRLKKLFDDSIKMGARCVSGGVFDRDNLYISPTILENLSFDSPIMQEEIFGPILPVIAYSDFDSLAEQLLKQTTPLALYIFSNSDSFKEQALNSLPSGGVCLGHAIIQLMNANLPFGGVGHSGLGAYHGHSGFLELSHRRSVLDQGPLTWTQFVAPPYGKQADIISKLNLKISDAFAKLK